MTAKFTSTALAALMVASAAPAFADEITFLCYQDGNECDVIGEMLPNSPLPQAILLTWKPLPMT